DGDRAAGPALAVAGYVAPWDPRSRAALDRAPAPLTQLSPVWYRPAANGELELAADQDSGRSAETAPPPSGDVPLVPSVSNFRDGAWDGALVAAILDDPAARRAHIRALVAVARRPGAAGVDLDYESLPADRRADYSRFVRDLAGALHDAGRTLSVTVHAKTEEPGEWDGARAQDWRALGAAADTLRIMAYDHAWPGSPPGPVAPVPWVEDVVSFAVSQVPRDKLVLGLATYGYDWPDGGAAGDVAWADAVAIADAHGTEPRWDAASASPWFTYTDPDGTPHTVWFEDARSLAARLEVARRHGLAGVFVWRLGGEDPAIWDVLGEVTAAR
ncbi:MAG TPA: glycosyl hydrolase family 18 protein, partial [Acidimicrobiales bacterium]